MAIVEDRRAVTGGVDTHLDVNVAAALNQIGGLLGVERFSTDVVPHRSKGLRNQDQPLPYPSRGCLQGDASHGQRRDHRHLYPSRALSEPQQGPDQGVLGRCRSIRASPAPPGDDVGPPLPGSRTGPPGPGVRSREGQSTDTRELVPSVHVTPPASPKCGGPCI